MKRVAVIGMAGNSAFLSVDEFHRGGETVTANAIHFEPGGKGLNQAVAAARFGARVSFLCAIGEEYQNEIRQFLINEGISPVLVQKKDATAFAAILTDGEGNNHVTVYPGAGLSARDVSLFEEEIAQADVLLLNNEVPTEVNEKAVEAAKRNGVFIILNPAPARALPETVLGSVDLFTPNEYEIEGLEDQKNVVVTLGDKGCLLRATGEVLPALSVSEVVDTTGAGDTFNGVLAARLAEGNSLVEATRDAICASGVSVTRKYAAGGIPTEKEVAIFCEKQK